ncbi:MAG: endonuclease V [Candidatus Hodarchaeota archaeon]
MIYQELLNDKITIAEAEEIQIKYAKIVREKESNLRNFGLSVFENIERVVGVDVSYYQKGNLEFGVASAILWDLKKGEIIYKDYINGGVNFPYIAGFLGFREIRLLTQVLLKLSKNTKLPDVVMCDGHGIIHPRRFGEALHLGLSTHFPTFGVAKNPYVGYADLNKLGKNKGDKVTVVSEHPDLQQNSTAEVLGYAIRLNNNAKPVYVSKGYRITLDLAVKIALEATLDHRLPEPLYLADKFSREKVKEIQSEEL